MSNSLQALIFVIIFFISPVLAAAGTGPSLGPSELSSRKVGDCVITAAHRHMGVSSELRNVCTVEVPRVFRQLGLDNSESPFVPVDIRVVEHPGEMQKLAPQGSRLPVWSGAVAFPAHNLVVLPLQRLDGGLTTDLETTLVHEISHIAFYRVSNGARTPRWFSEGVAILQSEGSSFHRKQSIWWASLIDDIAPLSEIEKYPEGAKAAEQAYAQAADFTAFLIAQEGWNSIRYLLSNLREGERFGAAFALSYGHNVAVLEKEWRSQLFGGMGWLKTVTDDGVWLGFGALLCILAFFVVRKRKHERLRQMEEEESRLDEAIATIDQLILAHPDQGIGSREVAVKAADTPGVTGRPVSSLSVSPVMERIRKQRNQIEIDGKIHTIH